MKITSSLPVASTILSNVFFVTEILKTHADTVYHKSKEGKPLDIQPYLAIPHVRDMLIPPKER